jgi:phosphate transport system substrate-binding protein
MAYGSVKNAAGEFIKADIASVTEAAAATVKDMPEDFRFSITNAPSKRAYPISSYTYLLIPAAFQDQAKGKQIKLFLEWMLTEGQKSASSLDYAPLPAPVVAKEKKQLAMLDSPSMSNAKKK